MRLRALIPACLILLSACSTDDPTRHNTFIPLTAIEVSATYDVMADQTVNQYTAVGDFSGAFIRDITSEVSWSIASEEIATVSNAAGSEGLVTARVPGDTIITAVFGDVAESAPVVVTDAFLTGIEIVPQDAELQSGVTLQYEAAGIFSDDSSQDITTLVTWESSDAEVATIDNRGVAATLAPGASTISATWQEIAAKAGLLVTGAALTAVSIIPDEATIARGTTAQLTAEGLFSDDTTQDITDMVQWQSDDPVVGTVNGEGLASGIAPGEAEISAAIEADGTTLSATAILTVTNAVIESILITPDDSTITAGESRQFTATGRFSDNSEQDITGLASWFSSNTTAGTISNSPDSRGLFTSIDAGATVIEAVFGGIRGATLLTVQ